MLKKGDICPCCGKPIKTDDPRALQILTEIAGYLKDEEEKKESDGHEQTAGSGKAAVH